MSYFQDLFMVLGSLSPTKDGFLIDVSNLWKVSMISLIGIEDFHSWKSSESIRGLFTRGSCVKGTSRAWITVNGVGYFAFRGETVYAKIDFIFWVFFKLTSHSYVGWSLFFGEIKAEYQELDDSLKVWVVYYAYVDMPFVKGFIVDARLVVDKRLQREKWDIASFVSEIRKEFRKVFGIEFVISVGDNKWWYACNTFDTCPDPSKELHEERQELDIVKDVFVKLPHRSLANAAGFILNQKRGKEVSNSKVWILCYIDVYGNQCRNSVEEYGYLENLFHVGLHMKAQFKKVARFDIATVHYAEEFWYPNGMGNACDTILLVLRTSHVEERSALNFRSCVFILGKDGNFKPMTIDGFSGSLFDVIDVGKMGLDETKASTSRIMVNTIDQNQRSQEGFCIECALLVVDGLLRIWLDVQLVSRNGNGKWCVIQVGKFYVLEFIGLMVISQKESLKAGGMINVDYGCSVVQVVWVGVVFKNIDTPDELLHANMDGASNEFDVSSMSRFLCSCVDRRGLGVHGLGSEPVGGSFIPLFTWHT